MKSLSSIIPPKRKSNMDENQIPQIDNNVRSTKQVIKKKVCNVAEKYMDDISNVTIDNISQLVKEVISTANDAGKKKIREKMDVTD